ncbi:uncharacterized protein LOC143556071 [Bidens hawaiensis]|uniref:uncharacterized protein LOC143556071 n=1 Tax=Bidens hawaiensis TaxID=980011 RepID=UPI00404A0855
MKDDEAVGEYFSRVMNNVGLQRSYGEELLDQKIVEKILRSLSQKYDYVIPSIEVTFDLSEVTPVKLMGLLQSQEERINRRLVSTEKNTKWVKHQDEQALQVFQDPSRVTRGRGRGRENFRGKGAGRGRGSKNSFTFLDESFKLGVKLGDKKRLEVEGSQNPDSLMTVEDNSVPTQQEKEAFKWHKRFSHLNFDALKQLHEKEMVIGLPKIYATLKCESCIVGKQTRKPFNSTSWRASTKLGLVHTDLCGPMQTPRLYNPVSKQVFTKRYKGVEVIESQKWVWKPSKDSNDDTYAFVDPFPYNHAEVQLDTTSNSNPTPPHDNDPTPPHATTLEPTYTNPTNPQHSQNLTPNIVNTSNTSNTSSTLHHTSQQNPTATSSKRPLKPPTWLNDYHSGEGLSDSDNELLSCQFALSITDPILYTQAAKNDEWVKAMENELQAIEKNNTWELVTLPSGKNVVGIKWLYKTKVGVDGNLLKHKARLVAKGYSQLPGIDYQETFAPVARFETIRVFLAVAAHKGWFVHQLDVKSAFLNGELSEEIYVEQPEGYVSETSPEKVYRLRKALYGLKQAPRAWYSKIDWYFSEQGYKRSQNEPTLYVKKTQSGIIYVCLYVDDIICTSSHDELIQEFKESMKQAFEMTDMGHLKLFLGLEVKQTKEGIFLHQQKKSLSAYVFTLGSGVVSWSSKKQTTVALSSTEAEYIAVTGAACQAIWLRRILEDLDLQQEGPTVIFCDNKSTINLSKNPSHHSRAKHIELKYHFIREMVEQGKVVLQFCSTHEQVADVLTKQVTKEKFVFFRHQLGVMEFESRGHNEE